MGDDFIYQRLASELAQNIERGAFRRGSRLPSLRAYSRQHHISLTTALQVYRQLEEGGLIESRPRSGYFVRPQECGQACEPSMSRPSSKPRDVTVAQMTVDILNEARRSDLLNLGAAEPGPDNLPLKSLARIMASQVRRHPEVGGRYERPTGNLILRERIAERLRTQGCACRSDELIITNGCQEALVLSLRAVARPGATIAIESPTFYGILQSIESLGMKALELPTHPRSGIDLDALELVMRRGEVDACLLIPSFNNPLGSCMPLAARTRLAALVAETGIPLIEDDVYGDLSFERPRLPTIKSLDSSGLVLLCSSFSKTLAPGYRIGYVLAGKYAEKVGHLKMLGNVATAGLPQLALAEYLQRGGYERLVSQAAHTYRWRSEQMRSLVLEHFPEGTLVTQPQGGFVLWVEMPPEVDCARLHDLALGAGISITPGVIFSPRGDYRHHIRISCGQLAIEPAAQAIARLGGIAKALPSGKLACRNNESISM